MKANYGRYALMGALLAAFLAALAHVKYLKTLKQERTVVVVSKDVQPYQKLDATNLTLKRVPADAVRPEHLTRLDDAKGRFSRTMLLKGDMVRTEHVADPAGGSLSTRLSVAGREELRAMAIRVGNDTGLSDNLLAGDRVDVLVTLRVDAQDGQRSTMTKVIAEGVPVLVAPSNKGDGLSGGRDSIVVLQVSQDLAADIAFAQSSGTMWLLLRPFDAPALGPAGVSMESFLKKHGMLVQTPARAKEGKS